MVDCSICLCELNEEISGLPCSHSFHSECIRPWAEKNNSCPLCRTPIAPTAVKIPLAAIGGWNLEADGWAPEAGSGSDSDDEEKTIDYGDESDFEEECAFMEERAGGFYGRPFNFRVSSALVVSII